jgi:hypothetical protein
MMILGGNDNELGSIGCEKHRLGSSDSTASS